MSKRRETTDKRCPRCSININYCFCHLIPKIKLNTSVSIIYHLKEYFLTSNTGKIANLALENSEYFVRGNKEQIQLNLDFESKEYQSLYLFPSEEAIELTTEYISSISKPIKLIVPDATWNQAKKFHKRESALFNIPHIKLPTPGPSLYTLRKQKSDFGLCTLEAIAHALGIIESQNVKDKLLEVLTQMNQRVMETRTTP